MIFRTLGNFCASVVNGREKVRAAKYRIQFSMEGITCGRGLRMDPTSRLKCSGGGRVHIGANVTIKQLVRITVFPGGSLIIGDGVYINAFSNIEVSGNLTIGRNSAFNDNFLLACTGQIDIGEDVLISSQVFIADHMHETTDLDIPISQQGTTAPRSVHIGNGAWLGTKSSILHGVSIGEGAIVGANAVVTKDIPPYAIAVGIPAKVIRYRTSKE